MVLNALRVDPGPTRPAVSPIICGLVSLTCLGTDRQTASAQWREDGVWRWFDESVLDLSAPAMVAAGKVTLSCIKEVGVTLDQFTSLAEHNGARVQMYHPEDSSEAQFRSQLIRASRVHAAPHIVVAFRCAHTQYIPTSQQHHRTRGRSSSESVLVMHVFSRRTLAQTGDGHFSPVAGYHAETDSVLVLDVARFKYPPYWVPIPLLWEAMKPHDRETGTARGFAMLDAKAT